MIDQKMINGLSKVEQIDALDLLVMTSAKNVFMVEKNTWEADCPNHQSGNRSLVFAADPLILKCSRGCSVFLICEGLLIDPRSLFPDRWMEFWVEQSDAIYADPGRLMDWTKEAVKTGYRLNPEEQKQYLRLCSTKNQKPGEKNAISEARHRRPRGS